MKKMKERKRYHVRERDSLKTRGRKKIPFFFFSLPLAFSLFSYAFFSFVFLFLFRCCAFFFFFFQTFSSNLYSKCFFPSSHKFYFSRSNSFFSLSLNYIFFSPQRILSFSLVFSQLLTRVSIFLYHQPFLSLSPSRFRSLFNPHALFFSFSLAFSNFLYFSILFYFLILSSCVFYLTSSFTLPPSYF